MKTSADTAFGRVPDGAAPGTAPDPGYPPGTRLPEVLATGPLPAWMALDMLDPLAQSMEEAHRRGRVLGCSDPRRVFVTTGGGLGVVPGPPPAHTTAAADVCGLGAVLYALLTAYWPLVGSPGELGGLARAPRDERGVLLTPTRLRPGVAVEVSALAMAALGIGAEDSYARLRTAGAVSRVIEELRAEWSEQMLRPTDDTEVGIDEIWRTGSRSAAHPGSKRKLRVSMLALTGATLGALGLLGFQAVSAFGFAPEGPPRIVVSTPAAVSPAAMTPAPDKVPGPSAAGTTPGAAAPAARPVPPKPRTTSGGQRASSAAIERQKAKAKEQARKKKEREQRERNNDSNSDSNNSGSE